MKNEQRILELLAEVLHKVDALSGEMTELKSDVKDLGKRMERVEKDIKLNIIGAENSRAILKLAGNSDRRLTRLEKAVFK